MFVLHHLPHATHILREIARTCHPIVVFEDVTTGPMHRLAIEVLDELGNWEFLAHPDSSHTTDEWHGVFKDAIQYPYCVTQTTASHATAKASLMGHHIFQIEVQHRNNARTSMWRMECKAAAGSPPMKNGPHCKHAPGTHLQDTRGTSSNDRKQKRAQRKMSLRIKLLFVAAGIGLAFLLYRHY